MKRVAVFSLFVALAVSEEGMPREAPTGDARAGFGFESLSDEAKEKIREHRRTVEAMSNPDNWQSPVHEPRHTVRTVTHVPDEGCKGIACPVGSICQLTKKGQGKCFKHCDTTCGHPVHHGWVGHDDGSNYCNKCKCRDGNLICKDEIECPESHPCPDSCTKHSLEKKCQLGYCHSPDTCTCVPETIHVCAKEPCAIGKKKCGTGYECVNNYCGGCNYVCKELDCTEGVPEKWTIEKQEYCCEEKGLGCSFKDCENHQLQVEETYEQYHNRRIWCCAHREIGCPSYCYIDANCPENEECRPLIKEGGGCTEQLYCFPKVPAGYPCGGWSLPCYVMNCKDDLVCATITKKDDRGVCMQPCTKENPCHPNLKCTKDRYCVPKKTCDDLDCHPYQCEVSEMHVPSCLTRCRFTRDGFASDHCVEGMHCVPNDLTCQRYEEDCDGYCGTLDDLQSVVAPGYREFQKEKAKMMEEQLTKQQKQQQQTKSQSKL